MKILLALLTIFISISANSANLSFLQNSLLSEFTRAEANEFKQFISKSLDTLPDQKVVIWKAQSSELQGKFKANFTYNSDGITCRHSSFLITNESKREQYQFDICNTDGKWRIQETPTKSLKKQDWQKLRQSVYQALDHNDIGIPFSWHNKKTGNSGSHVVLNSVDRDKSRCKNIAITIFNKRGQTSNGVYMFCKNLEEKDEISTWQRHIDEIDLTSMP